MDPASERLAGIAFGRFQVLPDRREVLADGRSIKLGGRAFDVLMTLIEAHGAVVSREALMTRVWQGRIIQENSLASQIAALRAAFGTERALIRTVSGRGYQFTGEISVVAASPGEPAGVVAAPAVSVLSPTNVPEPVSELIGREEELSEILNLVATHRLVTLTGAGGIGKTTLALALSRELRPHFADGVWRAEFSALADPGLVPATVAAAVGLELSGGEVSAQRVAQGLADRRLLLAMDTCEHVIAAAAAMAEAMLGAGSALHILATSREPLRAEGERVYPVPPLAVPAGDVAADDDPLRYGAVRLFIDRARAAEPHFVPDRRLMAMIAAICRRLDGIPLAIELAAARASALGIEALAARLHDRFGLLTGGRRTALPRHQALRATLDWSYELLAEPERVILWRLAVFAGLFSLEAGAAVAGSPELAAPDVIEGLLGLIAKSLVVAEGEGAVARYRLLDTTRIYALEKLEQSGERERLAHRHAEYYRLLFERAEVEWERRPTIEWLDDYGWCIDNLRAALDWAFSPGGDASLGVALTAAAVPLWMQLSLMEESRGRVEQALAAVRAGTTIDLRGEMRLHGALGATLVLGRFSAPELGAGWVRALEIAELLDDAEYQLHCLWGLWNAHNYNGRHRVALDLAQRFCTIAADRPDLNHRLVGERILGVSHHLLGDQRSARLHLERVLSQFVPSGRRSYSIRSQSDVMVAARSHLAQVLWLLGCPDQATKGAAIAVDDARATGHAFTLCFSLALAACPVALSVGDLARAERYTDMLFDHSRRHALTLWHSIGRIYQELLAIKRSGAASAQPASLLASFDEAGSNLVLKAATFMDVKAEAFAHAGDIGASLVVISESIEESERNEELWLVPELQRRKGELLLLGGAPGAAETAEQHFRQALDCAHRQGALSWELRAATSLARLLRYQGRPAEGMALLRPVYDCFTEGFDTTDLKAARALLAELA